MNHAPSSLADQTWLLQAIELSKLCPKSPTSFAVGAVIVDARNRVIATGYSLELGEHLHAEEIALLKADRAGLTVSGATIYSTLEPCSVRKSGKRPCVERIVEAGLRRVVHALDEPPTFVECHSVAYLRQQGIAVTRIEDLADQVRAVNSHLLGPPPKE